MMRPLSTRTHTIATLAAKRALDEALGIIDLSAAVYRDKGFDNSAEALELAGKRIRAALVPSEVVSRL